MLRMLAASALTGAAVLLLDRLILALGGARRWAWASGIAVVLLLPFLSWLAPSFPGSAFMTVGVQPLMSGLPGATGVEAGLAGPGNARSLTDLIGWFWLAAGAAFLTLYAAGWWRLSRERRAWRAADVAGTSVLVSPGAGPAAVGVLQPAIVVPEWLLSEEVRVQRLVVLHETEHLAAGDHLLLAIAPLAIVAMPWNVALWWMVRRLRLAVELDCDRRVLSRGVEAGVYGLLLLDVAGRRGVGQLSIAMASPRTNLESRILALTAGLPRRRTMQVVSCAAFSLLLAGLACEVAPVAPLDFGEATDRASAKPGMADLLETYATPGARYTIDDRPADRSEVLSLDPSDIGHIAIREQAKILSAGTAADTTLESRVIMLTTVGYDALHPLPEGEAVSGITRGQSLPDIVRTLIDRMPDEEVHLLVDGDVVDPDRLADYAARTATSVEVVRQRGGSEAKATIRIHTDGPAR